MSRASRWVREGPFEVRYHRVTEYERVNCTALFPTHVSYECPLMPIGLILIRRLIVHFPRLRAGFWLLETIVDGSST